MSFYKHCIDVDSTFDFIPARIENLQMDVIIFKKEKFGSDKYSDWVTSSKLSLNIIANSFHPAVTIDMSAGNFFYVVCSEQPANLCTQYTYYYKLIEQGDVCTETNQAETEINLGNSVNVATADLTKKVCLRVNSENDNFYTENSFTV